MKSQRSRKVRFNPANEHPSVVKLMAEALDGERPEDVIRRKCQAMVARAKSYGWSGPPFDPVILAELHRVSVESFEGEFEGEARVFSRREKVVIQVKPQANKERWRFTVCHELAHTCFPDCFELVRHWGGSSEDDQHKRFETLCDVGAAELLMPHEEFSADLLKQVTCIGSAQSLGKRYLASPEAAIRRLLHLTEHSCVAAFLTDRSSDTHSAVSGRLRVKYFVPASGVRCYLPPGTLVPLTSSAYNAPDECEPVFRPNKETWWINDQPRSWYVEPMKLPVLPEAPDYPRVVALLHTRIPPDAKTGCTHSDESPRA